jgi:hypothetical protein
MNVIVLVMQAGNDVSFGALTVTQKGLVYDAEMLPWADIKSLQVSDTMVIKATQEALMSQIVVSLAQIAFMTSPLVQEMFSVVPLAFAFNAQTYDILLIHINVIRLL